MLIRRTASSRLFFLVTIVAVVGSSGLAKPVDKTSAVAEVTESMPTPTPDPGLHYLTYDDAVQIALHDNVDLLALRSQEDGFRYQSIQALAPNEPTVTWLKNDLPSFRFSDEQAQEVYQVSWTLGFPGKALSNSASIRHQAESLSEQARNQEVTIITSLSNSYVTFVTNDAFYKLLLDEQQRDKALIKLIEKRFAGSQASKVDLLNAQVATQQIALAIIQNRNDYEVALTQFRQLLRRPSDKTLAPRIPEKIIVPQVKQTFDDLTPVMLRNNHTVLAAARTLDSQSSAKTNAFLQAFPDFQLMGAKNTWLPGPSPLGPDHTQDYSISIGIVVPLFYPLNEYQGYRAARSNYRAAEYQYTSQQLQAVAALQTAYTSLKATIKDIDTSERLVVPAAKESFDLTLVTYALGKADYLIVNQARQVWHDASRDLFTKRQNAAQFYNQLISLMGCDIEKTEGPNACK